MERAHRAVVSLAHGVQHRDDLVSAYLSDDHAVGIHSQTHAYEFGGRDLARPFDVRLACFECNDVGVDVGKAIETEFKFGFDRYDSLLRWDLRSKRAKHRRLAGAGRTGHDDLLSGAYGGSEEVALHLIDRAESHEVW